MVSLPQQSVLIGPVIERNFICINKAFEEVAKSEPNRVALIFEENGYVKKHTYVEVDEVSNRLARAICQIFVEHNFTSNSDGDYIIAVSMYPSDNLVMTLLAIWKAGATYVSLEPSFPKQRVEHILQETMPSIIIHDEDAGNFENVFKLSFTSLLFSSSNYISRSLSSDEYLTSKDSTAVILYTSGSTGIPKGVRLSHASILNRIHWQFRTLPFNKTESIGVFKTAFTFIDSIIEIWSCLVEGLTVLVLPKAVTQNPEKLVKLLEKYKIERMLAVTSLMKILLTYLQIDNTTQHLPYLKTWIVGGEPVPKSLVAEFFKYFKNGQCRLYNFYGITETTGDISYYSIQSLEQLEHYDKVPIGLPIDNIELYILDSNLRPVKPGEVGEIFVAGISVSIGYVNGRDSERFIENPFTSNPNCTKLYRTGDLGQIKNGILLFEGRTDQQIKIRGHRIDTSEIENAISAVEGVEKAAVLYYKPGSLEERILAFVKSGAMLKEDQIQKILKQTLISYMLPHIILVDAIPFLINGKTDTQVLLKHYEDLLTSNKGTANGDNLFDFSSIPQSQMGAARILFETTASILKPVKTPISTKSNFFDMGGTSLNLISIIMALREKGYCIGIKAFATAKNFKEVLSKMVSGENSSESLSTITSFYSREFLSEEYKEIVKNMIYRSFRDKSLFGHRLEELSLRLYIDKLWEFLTRPEYEALNFIVKNKHGCVIAVALSYDMADKPNIEVEHPKMRIFLEFFDNIEKPVTKVFAPFGKGKILNSFIMATHPNLTAKEDVDAIYYMEEAVLEIAKDKKFETIMTANTNRLAQQLVTDVFLYQTCGNVQVNHYIASDGTKPFGDGDDSWRVLVQTKTV